MPETLQLAYRTGKSVSVFNASPEYASDHKLGLINVVSRASSYSPDGRYFAWSSPNCVTVVDTLTSEVVTRIPRPQVIEIDFSPKGTYISTYQNWTRDDSNRASKNISIWNITDGRSDDEKEPLSEYHQSTPDCWKFQFTDDEAVCGRRVADGVTFFQSPDFRTVWKKARVEGIASFALAPTSLALAVYVPMRKGDNGAVRVYRSFTFDKPVSQRPLFKGDRVRLEWNSTGTCLLVLATTDVDAANKSYYGEHNLHVLHAQLDLTASVTFDKAGPIHDVQWSPSAKSFAVVYGFMPANVTVFNLRAEASHKFENPGSRNTVLFSPHGRFLLIAGFGNLSGQMDIYDLERDYEKVSTIDGNIATVCSWAPDGQHILTATCSPRMVVDNRVRIWHVSGNVMFNQEIDDLLHVSWRPRPTGQYPLGTNWKNVPAAHSSAAAYLATVRKPVKTGVYRPPGAGGSYVPTGSNGIGGRRYVPGAEPATEPEEGKNLAKTRRRKEKKAHREAEAGEGTEPKAGPRNGRADDRANRKEESGSRRRQSQARRAEPSQSREASNVGGVSLSLAEVEVESENGAGAESDVPVPNRRVRTLLKKLREIEQLKMRQAGGEALEVTQLSKIHTEVEFRKELNGLGFDEGMDLPV